MWNTVTYNNSDWAALYAKTSKAQKLWGVVAKVTRQTGVYVKSQAMMYNVVVQTVLIYGCESWVVKGVMMMVLEGFHHIVARRLAGLMARRGKNGEWEWPPVATALQVTGLWPTWVYVRNMKFKIEEYIAECPIFEMCTRDQRKEVSNSFLCWYDNGKPEEGIE